MNIYISTSDNYHHCLQPFAFLFNKFWSTKQKVKFVGYKEPDFDLPSNFEFISLGKQRGPSFYGEDFNAFFQSIDDTYFIYTMEDQFIYDYVDVSLIDKLENYIINENVGRICLTNSIYQTHMGKRHEPFILSGSLATSHYELDDSEYELVKFTPASEFRITCEWTIWDKEYLLKYLLQGLNPWQFEDRGSMRAKKDGRDLIGCKNVVPIQHGEALRKFGRSRVDVGFDYKFVNEDRYLSEEVISEMKEQGVILK